MHMYYATFLKDCWGCRARVFVVGEILNFILHVL